jgi:predicted Zn finger-like uncharacterized protein
MIRIACPNCSTLYTLDDAFYGKTVRCQRCSHSFTIDEGNLVDRLAGAQELRLEFQQPALAAADPAGPDPEPTAPPPRRQPRRPRRRVGNKSIAGPALVMGLTVLLVGGVIIGSIYYLIHAFNEEEARPRYVGPSPTIPLPTNPLTPPTVDTTRKADFEVKSVDSQALGLAVLHPRGPSWPVVERPPANAGRETAVAKLKQSTAYLRVNQSGGDGSGSGFFALEPGLLVTNAHVVGMMRPSDADPTELEVIINSNEANEVRLKGSVVAVDRKHDLALVRVRGANLPPPLSVISSSGLAELQDIFAGGFPLGSTRGKNIAVNPGAVSSLLKEAGVLAKVQIQADLQPGNSGGPVVDSLGRVVGVSVAIIRDTQINFAVPTDFLNDLYRGAVRSLYLYPPSMSGDALLLPVIAHFDDAFGRIDTVALDWWIGDPGDPRPASVEPPPPLAGDQPRSSVALAYARARSQGQARAELSLPPLPDGKVYWLQLATVDKRDKSKRYYTAHSYRPGRLLTRSSVRCGAQPASAVDGQFDYRSNISLRSEHGDLGTWRLYLRKRWEDEPAPDRAAHRVKTFNVGARQNEEPLRVADLVQMLPMMGIQPHLQDRSDVSSLGSADKFLHGSLGTPFLNLPRDLGINLPEGTIDPLRTNWGRTAKLTIPYVLGRAEVSKFNLKCSYLGVEKVEGRNLAVVRLEGTILQTPEVRALGTLWGIARVDVETNTATDVYALVELEMENIQLMPVLPANADSLSFLGSLEFSWSTKPRRGQAEAAGD